MKTRLLKTALVAAVAGITLLGMASTASADPETKADGDVSFPGGISVYSAAGQASEAGRLQLEHAGAKQYVYCIDIKTSIKPHKYIEGDWDNSGVPNLGKIKWILHNSFPNVTPADVLKNADATLPDTYDADEVEQFVYAATQAAIWNQSDAFELRATNSTPEADDVDAAVSAIYDYLKTNAQDMPNPGEPSLDFEGPTTGKIGDKVGPIKVSTNLGEITLTVTGGKAVDKNGKEVTKVKGGDEFYLTSDKVGTVSVTGTGEVNIPIGRIFVSEQGQNTSQKLILAGGLVKPGEAKYQVKLADRPALAVTGASLTIFAVSGAALLAGGFALAMFLRRRRAASATWGGEDDGIA